MNDYKGKIDCDISPRELSYALSEFHRAPSGDGALGFTWQDKPHRIVYDLIAAVKYYAMRVAELESRLEISPLHNVDGIMARDATIKLQDERIAELEAERAERERQEPIATVGWDRNFMGVVWHGKDMPEKGVETLLYAAPPVTEQGCVTVTTDESGRAVAVTRQDDDHRILSVIWEAPPVAAPVRLTDEQVERALRTNGAYESDAAYAMAKDGLLTDARAVETAVLRANGFKVEE